MSNYIPVPVEAAKTVAEQYAKHAVVILTYDREYKHTHVTTYGVLPAEKVGAARVGEIAAKAIGCTPGDSWNEDFRHNFDEANYKHGVELVIELLKASDVSIPRLFRERLEQFVAPHKDNVPHLGSCCACGSFEGVRNILSLHKKAPVPGRGWGCFVCKLPNDGAIAVICDRCLESKAKVLFACSDYPAKNVRVPIDSLTGTHDHDMSKHPGEAAAGN